MATVNFNSIGSGIDFNTIRDAIIAQRSRPIVQLQAKSSDYSQKIDSLKKLNSILAKLTTSVEALKSRDLGNGRIASATDASILTVSATATAAVGETSVNVTRTATGLSQASRSFSSATAPLLSGGATTATFELRKGGAATGSVITIDSTNDSLNGLKDAINAANAGVSASIVDISGNGTDLQLVLNSKDTGAAGRVELVEASSTGTGTDLNLRSLNPPDNDFTKLDASFSVNGLQLTRSSNTVSDVLTGVTFNLKKAGTSNVNVTASNEITDKLNAFIGAYNEIVDAVAQQYTKDAKGRPTGVLAGENVLRDVQRQLRDAIGQNSITNGGTLTGFNEIGLNFEADGHLKIDNNVLSEKLKTKSDDVRALLFGKTAAETGLAQSIYTVADSLSNSTTGSVQTAIKGFETSITSTNASIERRTEVINRLRDSLTKQFAAADTAIGLLNSQQTSLTNVLKSLEPKRD